MFCSPFIEKDYFTLITIQGFLRFFHNSKKRYTSVSITILS
jgi:hypothetical protein